MVCKILNKGIIYQSYQKYRWFFCFHENLIFSFSLFYLCISKNFKCSSVLKLNVFGIGVSSIVRPSLIKDIPRSQEYRQWVQGVFLHECITICSSQKAFAEIWTCSHSSDYSTYSSSKSSFSMMNSELICILIYLKIIFYIFAQFIIIYFIFIL